jgi:hypothetical protein
MRSILCLGVIFFTVQLSQGQSPAGPSDWIQFRGNNRDAISPDKNLLKDWPKVQNYFGRLKNLVVVFPASVL